MMPFIDLQAQQAEIRAGLRENIERVLAHGKYISGPEVGLIEEKVAAFAGVEHAVSCASGTDALLLVLMALGVGPGHAVFTTPFTFVATAEVIALLGATPVFVDIDPRTYNLDPARLEDAIRALARDDSEAHPLPGRKNLTPKAVIPVDLFGLPADYERINAAAREHGLFVIEDAAQSLGGRYKGRMAGSLADAACTSFFPAKPLGCYGDGGMCLTDNDDLAETLASLRVHGKGSDKYHNVRVGLNSRLDTLQAAVLLAKFEVFPGEVEKRRAVARAYDDLLGQTSLVTPEIPGALKSVYAQYSVLAADARHRELLQNTLRENGVPTVVYYPVPLHLQPVFEHLGYARGDFPVSEAVSERIFSLPMHPYLERKDQERIARVIGGVSGTCVRENDRLAALG